jgi:hypothetical protein
MDNLRCDYYSYQGLKVIHEHKQRLSDVYKLIQSVQDCVKLCNAAGCLNNWGEAQLVGDPTDMQVSVNG